MMRRGRPRRPTEARSLSVEEAVCSICHASFTQRERRQDGSSSQAVRRNDQWYHQDCFRNSEIQRERRAAQSCTLNLPLYSNLAGCVFNGCIAEQADIVIDKALRDQCVAYKTTIIQKGSRVCEFHLRSLLLLDFEATDLIQIADEVRLSSKDATGLFRAMSKRLQEQRKKASNALDFSAMDSDRLECLIGLNRERFNRLKSRISFDREGKKVRYVDLTLGVYLLKMKRGLSDEFIGALLNVGRRGINTHINRARDLFQRQFSIDHLPGLGSLGPRGVWQHTSSVAKALYSNEERAVLVVDGTYIYLQKSMNFDFQRRSFSTYKYRNLFKMLMVVTTDGYIVDAWGPHDANISDADLLEDYLVKHGEDDVLTQFEPSRTTFIVDRGFRNCIQTVRELGYEIVLPSSPEVKGAQLSWEEANRTRFVTKLRWVVEAVNGALKTWKYIEHTVVNRALPNAPHDFRNICALVNFTRDGGLSSDRGQRAAIIDRMQERLDKPNLLGAVVEANSLTRKTRPFRLMTEFDRQHCHFPRLTIEELQLFCCGSYQLKLVASYYWEHLQPDGRYKFYVSKEENDDIHYGEIVSEDIREDNLELYKCDLRSRHSGGTKYFLFVLINKEETGLDAILEHWCKCMVGSRTVGCCSHVATLVWYLAYACYLPASAIPQPARTLNDFFNEVELLPAIQANPQQAEEAVDGLIDEMATMESDDEDEEAADEEEAENEDEEDESEEGEEDGDEEREPEAEMIFEEIDEEYDPEAARG